MSSEPTLLQTLLSPQDYREAKAAKLERQAAKQSRWPNEYTNAETRKRYQPHHDQERRFVYNDSPRYALAKGGEGGGKSVAGIIKNLNRLRCGMSGIMVSPDFEHFKRSLWPEFRRWCPWSCVVEKDRYRQSAEWEASKPFQLHFNSEAGIVSTLYCGGIEDPNSWEGPNVSFAHFDEGRRHKTPEALKVLDGRVRILGPHDEPPQLYITTTPRKHWLFDYFGPLLPDDPRADFKRDSLVVNLLTSDNEAMGNLAAGYTQQRRQSLTEAEARVLLGAEWEDIDEVTRFLPSMLLWDACKDDLPPLAAHEPLVVILDGADVHDSFGLIGITAHPTRPQCRAIRFAYEWKPPKNGIIDHYGDESDPGPYWIIAHTIAPKYALVQVSFDPAGLYQLANRLMNEGIVQCVPFGQQADRLIADKLFFDDIISRNIWHDGNDDLRRHISNADRKPDPQSRRLRIVKREDELKIDLAVCASMGNKVATEIGLGV